MGKRTVDVSMVRTGGSPRSRVMAALSYMGILCFIPLVMVKDDEFVYFHAKQGLVIWMWGVVATGAFFLPGIGKWFFSFSAITAVLFSVIGLSAVLLGRAWKLPIIHNIANRI